MSSIKSLLDSLDGENRLRKIPEESCGRFIDLCSNDYLGLASNYKSFLPEFKDRFGDVSFSSSASRLLSCRQTHHIGLENFLTELYEKSILLFNSGYHANVGCISALSQLGDTAKSTLFICDKLIHASVIDGLRLAGAEFKRFPHNDFTKLREILVKSSPQYSRIIIVVESIYSMDGDLAPLYEIAELKNDYPDILIYVDEAHAFGVRGEKGLGLCEEYDLINKVDIIIGTFGKAAASEGAFVVCSDDLKSFFINFSRPFIFSTALPPVNVAWSHLMIEKFLDMKKEREYLKYISNLFKNEIEKITSWNIFSQSQIIPLLTGNATTAIAIADKLKENDVSALPIRRPTVPPGGERIRFSLNALLNEATLNSVLSIIKDTYNELRIY